MRAVHLRLAGVDHARLRARLFPGDGCEAVALGLAGRHQCDDREVLLLHEIVTLPPSAYIQRDPVRVSWTTDFLPEVLERANAKKQSIIKFHSHPSGLAQFSDVDDRSDSELFQSVFGWIDRVSLHGSVIMLPDGGMLARGITPDLTFVPAARITVVGDTISISGSKESEPWDVPRHASRHALLLGESTTRLLSKLRIGVVGCSGTGSFVLEELHRLGVGEIIPIDPEFVEDVNVNRILWSTMNDARDRVPKVELARRSAEEVGVGVKIRALPCDLATREAVLALAGCDAVFGCVDSHDGRRLLNRLASFYLLPYFDVGVRIDAGPSGIDHMSGAVHYLQPGGSSLLSRHVISTQRADAEALRRAHPDVYRDRLGEGYIRGIDDLARPAVISINGWFASWAVTEFLVRLLGCRSDNADYAEQRFCITDGYFSAQAEGNPCSALERHVGRGDVDPILDMPDLGCL